MESKTKTIVLDNLIKKVRSERPKKKRVVTQHCKWNFDETTLQSHSQMQIVQDLCKILDISGGERNGSIGFIKQQIHNKIHSYCSQDKEKGLYDSAKLITYNNVLDMFQTSELKCYYCKETTLILYEHVRNPKQWTLERLDNSLGHITENVVISCLHCNLRRRTMHSDRYLKTKSMSVVIKTET